MNRTAWLIAIVGPTASGKSALALALAERFGGEIVNFDSIQVYRGFDIGSGKLTLAERRGVRHHLIDCADASEPLTAGSYARLASEALERLRGETKTPVLVGGTGLYLRALLDGLFEGPQRSEALRERLRAIADRRGREFLHRMLVRFDRVAAGRISSQDLQKVIRAIEVSVLSRQPISAMQAHGRRGIEGFRPVKIGLNPPRNQLYARINRRVEKMFDQGLLDEVRALLLRPDVGRMKPLEALGYRQARAVLEGRNSLAEAIASTQADTRRYAKRQMTWFRREPEVAWFEGFGDEPGIERQVFQQLRGVLSAAPSAHPISNNDELAGRTVWKGNTHGKDNTEHSGRIFELSAQGKAGGDNLPGERRQADGKDQKL